MQGLPSFGFAASVLAGASLFATASLAAPPFVGPNVNMVQGTKWPSGDPFLTKQNEESHAISSRNPRHILAGSNDYRLVPVEIAEELDDPEAWVTIYKSIDGGATWRSTVVGGCPINIPACADATGLTAALKALKPNFGADPTIRPGPFGTFFLSSIAGTRDQSANGVVYVQRFVDKNNDIQRDTDVRACTAGSPGCQTVDIYTPQGCNPNLAGSCTGHTVANVKYQPAQDPILPDAFSIIDIGTPGQGKDKPWNAADVPRSWNAGKSCELLSWTKNRADVTNVAETVPAFNVYVSYANFTGQDPTNQHPFINVAVSSDCGKTFGKPKKISTGGTSSQGSGIAIDPQTGAVYVVWRGFTPNAIYVVKSTDGGQTWSKPVTVSGSNYYPYDQGATGVTFRTLGFPTIGVSVSGTQSRVHVAWAQRKAPIGATPPYACQSSNPADCDARIVMSTSLNGGSTWPAAVAVDSGFTVKAYQAPTNPSGSTAPVSHSRGHQVQPAMTFAAGKLVITWLDQRLDATEGVLVCPFAPALTPPIPADNSCSIDQRVEIRRAMGNLDRTCTWPSGVQLPPQGSSCFDANVASTTSPSTVFSTYLSDGTPGLIRRHTIDVYAAMVDPAATTTANFASSSSTRVSQYAFGSTVAGTINPSNGELTPDRKTYEIRQKEVFAPNLPLFANGTGAFVGDYIDVAGQIIVATGDSTRPYKWNVGGTVAPTDPYMTSGLPPVFYASWTDNKDVIPPIDGNWVTPTCLTTDFVYDSQGNVTDVTSNSGCTTTGFAGNRNQNVYSAVIAENSYAVANATAKLLGTTPRGFVVSVRNLSNVAHTYTLSLPAQAAGVSANFTKDSLLPSPPPATISLTSVNVVVQPRSTAARTVWVTSTSNPKARVLVNVNSPAGDGNLATTLVLNGDALANESFVTNTDGGGTNPDIANDDLGAVVLSNAVLTNNVLTNNALTNAVLTNNALTNAALSNVVLSNAVLTNLQLENVALSNNVLTNAALSNVVLTNAVLSNNALTNAVLSNVALSNSALNVALTNLDPANVALSNAALTNNALTNVALTNNALSNVMLTNAALTNAALTNVALSNAALTNNVLTNNALSNAVLTNAPLVDPARIPDPDTAPTVHENDKNATALRTIESASFEIGSLFTSGELTNSDFRETSFTVRNHGNTDATLAIKLMVRDAVCTPDPGFPNGILDGSGHYTCQTPGYKLQLVLRKIGLTPYAIPPTTPAKSTGRAFRIGLVQRNAEVSNVGPLSIVSPDDPTFGKFLPDDPKAATLSLASGEFAYATIRAVGIGGATPPDPADLLRWGVQAISANSTTATSPLLIITQSFTTPFIALDDAAPAFRTFGGQPTTPSGPVTVTATAACSDEDGNPVLQGTGSPQGTVTAAPGTFYIDTSAHMVYGPKIGVDNSGWVYTVPTVSPVSQFVNATFPPDPQTSLKAWLSCPITGPTVDPNPLTTNASTQISSTAVKFKPQFWGDLFVLTSAFDGTNAITPKDRQVVKATILPRPPVLTLAPSFPPSTLTPTSLKFQQSIDLAPPRVSSDSKNADGVLQPIVFNASGSCHMHSDGHTLLTDRATAPNAGLADCIVNISQSGNEIYASLNVNVPVFIDRAQQEIQVSYVPANNELTYNNSGQTVTLVATHSSPTAPPSSVPVTFASTSPTICTTTGTNGATLTVVGAGMCSITLNEACDDFANSCQGGNYYAAPQLAPPPFNIKKADQILAYGTKPDLTFGNAPTAVPVSSSSPTAKTPTGDPIVSGNPILLSAPTTPTTICTMSGTTLTIVHAGDCAVTGNQAGNDNFKDATAVSEIITIKKADQNITFGAAPSSVTFGNPPVTVSASSTSPQAPPGSGNPIRFRSDTPTICTNGPTVTILKAGTCTIAANQLGNNDYNDATQATQTFTIAQADQIIVFDPAPTGVTFGDPTFTVSATSSSPTAPNLTTTSIVFSTTTPSVCSTSGVNGATVSILSAGTCTIAANKACDGTPTCADGNYKAAAQVTQNINIAKAPTEFVVGPSYFTPFTSPTATPTIITGKLHRTGVAAVFPTDAATVVLRKGATTVNTYSPVPGSPDGAFTITDGSVASGDYTITFDYGASTNFLAATTATSTLRVEGFSATVDMANARTDHTATLLNDGSVLVVGGFDGTATAMKSVELYCPDSMSPAPTSGQPCFNKLGQFVAMPDMTNARAGHTATLLQNGMILVAGGSTFADELFDPSMQNWSGIAANVANNRFHHTATLLGNGKVFVAGGSNSTGTALNTTVIYTYAVAGGTVAAGPTLGDFRERHTATLLADANGRVLLAGGRKDAGATFTPLASAEVYDPVSSSVSAASAMGSARFSHTATLLDNDKVLVAGGSSDPAAAVSTSLQSFEIYTPNATTGTWSSLGSLNDMRREFTATILLDGFVIAAGGVNGTTSRVPSSELFDPAPAGPDTFAPGPPLLHARSGHTATLLPDGRVLVLGGLGGTGQPTKSGEFYNGMP